MTGIRCEECGTYIAVINLVNRDTFTGESSEIPIEVWQAMLTAEFGESKLCQKCKVATDDILSSELIGYPDPNSQTR